MLGWQAVLITGLCTVVLIWLSLILGSLRYKFPSQLFFGILVSTILVHHMFWRQINSIIKPLVPSDEYRSASFPWTINASAIPPPLQHGAHHEEVCLDASGDRFQFDSHEQLFCRDQTPHIFTDHMVLQQGQATRSGAKAKPARKSLSLSAIKSGNRHGRHGQLGHEIPELKVGGPYVLKVAGENTIEIQDVLVGEVWICSGQSNMQWWIRSSRMRS